MPTNVIMPALELAQETGKVLAIASPRAIQSSRSRPTR
jgi:hypothetical protein